MMVHQESQLVQDFVDIGKDNAGYFWRINRAGPRLSTRGRTRFPSPAAAARAAKIIADCYGAAARRGANHG